jgi:hypothetical protein
MANVTATTAWLEGQGVASHFGFEVCVILILLFILKLFPG